MVDHASSPESMLNNAVRWCDAHVHLADERLNSVRNEVLARARAHGITEFLEGGVNPKEWARTQALREDHRAGVHWLQAVGLHPWWVDSASRADVTAALADLRLWLEPGARPAGVVALGECGLDGVKNLQSALQEEVFSEQLRIAGEWELPLVLHIVRAHERAIAMLDAQARRQGRRFRGLVHSFSAGRTEAEAYLKLGLCLSVGTAVLKPGHKALKETLPWILETSPERLLIESDSPDQRARDWPGPTGLDLNEPVVILDVARAISRLGGVDVSPETLLDRSRRAFWSTALCLTPPQ